MNSPAEPIAVACAADDFFAMPLAVTVRSALTNLRGGRRLQLYILDGGIRCSNRRRIDQSLDSECVDIHWLNPNSPYLRAVATRCGNNYPISAYNRLLLPQLVPQDVRRIIYLDSDLVVLGDLAELWEMDFDGSCMLAAQDAANRNLRWPKHLDHLHLAQTGITAQDKYLQSGVLCIDLEKWRAEGIADEVIDFIATHPELPFPDQDALNLVLIGRWKEVDPRWNQLPVVHGFPSWQESPYNEEEFNAVINEPLIIHFGSKPKPWERGCRHPQQAHFFVYLEQTAWAGWRPTAWHCTTSIARRSLRRCHKACARFAARHRVLAKKHKWPGTGRGRGGQDGATGAEHMNFHVVLSRPFDLEAFAREAAADRCPRHAMAALAERLGAKVHQPGQDPVSPGDRIRSKIFGNAPEHWALARRLRGELGRQDVIFSIGEDTGYPIASLCRSRADGPRTAVFIHNASHPRGRLAIKWHRLRRKIDLFLTNTSVKADFLRNYMKLPHDSVFLTTEQTDVEFFTPGESRSDKSRPIIGSGGLEQRDYRTLAAATADLDVDVRVCAVSPNARQLRNTFPQPMPANMEARYYDWCELRQLYRDADVVVISLKQHNYQAGLTTLFESLACRRPVVMTVTEGIARRFADQGAIQGVAPGDSASMRRAILGLLEDPQSAQAQAARGYEIVQENYNSGIFVESIAQQVLRMAGCEPAQERSPGPGLILHTAKDADPSGRSEALCNVGPRRREHTLKQ